MNLELKVHELMRLPLAAQAIGFDENLKATQEQSNQPHVASHLAHSQIKHI